MTQPLWIPSPERVNASQMQAFQRFIEQRHGVHCADYAALHRWSIEQRAEFWQAVAEFFAVHFHQPASQVLTEGDALYEARWFNEARLNFAEHLLKRRDQHPALVALSEDGQREQLSYAELAAHVAGLQRSLKNLGIGPGDRIAALMPNTWQTLALMLAAASIGAIWSSCSPDFGVQGVLDRFGQIKPKLFLAATGYRYAGKIIDLNEKLQEIAKQLTSVEHWLLVPYAGCPAQLEPLKTQADASLWDDFYQASGSPEFTALPFAHPLYILYSSGTTGVPKCIVHGAGGTLLQHLKELGLHTNIDASSRFFYYSTCGWMMWNWLASGLALGATLFLVEGSPFHPSPERLLDLVDQERITHFGVSAKYLSALEKAGVTGTNHSLSSVQTVLSTGSPLAHESFDYVYQTFPSQPCLSSISGGTDIVSCFALGNPCLPVWRGELQCAGLGMAVEVWDEQGQPLTQGKGELVCSKAFPSMPLGFWHDEDGHKYHQAYFARFPKVWAHGDYAERTEHGGLIIHGRCDAVLNPGGVRIGTAEIYRQVEKLDSILDALVIGQNWQQDVRIVLFVKLAPSAVLDDALKALIRKTIAENTTQRHVPAKIIAVADIPRTRSGKLAELAVRNLVHGQAVNNSEALANPEALELFKELPELLC